MSEQRDSNWHPNVKRRSVIASIGATGIGTLAGCLSGGSESDDDDRTVFRIGGKWELDSDPLDGGGFLRRTGVTEALVKVDYDVNQVPGLATEWEWQDDNRWEFTLREGVTFHDGEPLDATAAVESLRRVADSAAFAEVPISAVEATDDRTVVVETETPFAPLPAHLSRREAVLISPNAIEADGSITEPISTGPFKIESFDPSSELRAVRNDDYYGPQPEIESVRYEVVQDDQTRRLKLENDEIEMARIIPNQMVSELEETDGIDVYAPEIPRIRFLAFDTQSEPFDDIRVRRAVHHAVDRAAITESVLAGVTDPAVAPFSPDVSDWGNPELDREPHDLEHARSLLSDAGWEREGDDLRTRDGDELAIELLTFDARSLPLIGEVLQDQLGAVGIDLDVTVMEYAAMVERAGQDSFDTYLTSWGTLYYSDPDRLTDMFHSEDAGLHHGYANERVDTLLEEARELDDPDARQERYHEVQSLVLEDAPISVLTAYTNVVATASEVEDYQPHPTWYTYGVDSITLEK